MIRKSGIAIFVGLLLLIFVLVYFLIGPVLRFSMVYTLEKLFQAETNIEKVAVRLAPISLEITGLQITDKNQPANNLISFDRAHGDLQLRPLLMGYYIMDELALEGLAYGSPRKSPGEVYESSESETEEDGASSLEKLQEKLNVSLPSADEVMQKMDFKLVEKGEALQKQIDQQQAALKDIEKRIPDKARIEDLTQKIKTLSESKVKNAADLKTKAEQLKELQKQLRAERDNIKSIKGDIADGRDKLNESIAEVKQAKKGDWEKIKEVADTNNGGLEKISELLIGEQWTSRISQLNSFYQFIKPYIPGSDGDKEEPEQTVPNRILPIANKPYPNFLVKKIDINWLVGDGKVDMDVTDFTLEHEFTQQPTRYKAMATALPQLAEFKLDGNFSVKDVLTSANDWTIKGYQLSSIEGLENLGIDLEGGKLNTSGSLALKNNDITQDAAIQFIGAQFKSGGGAIAQKIVEVLNKQETIPFNVKANGTLSSPDLSVSSPLDKIVGDALLGDAKQKVDELKADLQSQLDSKLQEQLKGNEKLLAAYQNHDKQLDELDEMIEEALKAELKSVEDEAKSKVKDKLDKELKDKLPKFGG